MPTPSIGQAATSHNWVGSAQLTESALKPQYDNKLYRRYGDQNFVGLTGLLGGKRPVAGLEYMHSEEDWLHELLFVETNNTVYAAGALGTYTIAAGYQFSYPSAPVSPYISSTATNTNPLMATQIIEFPNGVQAIVQNVNYTTGVFTAYPRVATDVMPTTSTTDEIIILGNQKPEESTINPSRNFRTLLYKNNMQNMDGSAKVTGNAMAEQIWFEVEGLGGKMGYLWYYKQQLDEYVRIRNEREMQLITGKKTTNTTFANVSGNETSQSTEGLIPFIESYGNITTYNLISGVTLQDFENMITSQLDRNMASDENALYLAIKLESYIDGFIRDEMKEGGVIYNTFDGEKKQALNFGFDSFEILSYTFHMKRYNLFNYQKTLGANGHKYMYLGLVIPMDKKVRTVGYEGKSETLPSICVNYQSQQNAGGTYSRDWEEFLTGGANGIYTERVDKVEMNWRTTVGFEGFGANRFAEIALAS